MSRETVVISDDSTESDDLKGRPASLRDCRSCMRHHLFIILLIIGIAAGIGLGVGIRFQNAEFRENPSNVVYLQFPGDLMLRMLKVCIIPLVTFSLMHAVGSMAPKTAGKIGGFGVLYYMITTLMAVLLGMLLVATIQPGTRGGAPVRKPKNDVASGLDSFLDLVR